MRGSGCVAALALLLACGAPVAAAPRVTVTIKPLHSLVAGVMEGVGEPDLLIRGAGSPHTYNLRPSDARLLERAQVIFWVGGALETFMERPLATLGAGARVVEVLRAPGIALLSGRRGGAWDEHDAAGATTGERHAVGPHSDDELDGHLWLDPANARAIARVAAVALGEVDPANRERYARNADRLVARIDALDAEVAATLAPVRARPYVVFHDAYQYFERRYALAAIGSIAVSPERRPGARRVQEIRERIRSLGAICVFSEPQFPSSLLGTLTEGSGVRTGALDPEGADLPAGPDAWFSLMRGLAAALADCLRPR